MDWLILASTGEGQTSVSLHMLSEQFESSPFCPGTYAQYNILRH